MRFVKFNFGANDLTLNFTPFLCRISIIPWAYLKKLIKKNTPKTNFASSGVHVPVQIEILPAVVVIGMHCVDVGSAWPSV